MQRESRLGRTLWLVLLAVVGGYVLADFVRSPFSTPSGAAAVPPPAVTIWAPSGESGDESGPVLAAAARGLEARGHPTAVRSMRGGVAAALIAFLSHRRPGRGRMLAVTSTTIAALAQDRSETLNPGTAEEAALAWALLRHAKPVGLLAETPLEVAVEMGSRIRTGPELLASMVGAPGDQLFGIDDDVYLRDQLAALVDGAGVDGEVHFSTFQSSTAAAQAIRLGAARTILAGRPTILAAGLHGLGWPLAGRRPRAWVALVAPADVGDAQLRRLRTWVARLQRARPWRRGLRAEGRLPGAPGDRVLAGLLRHTSTADHLERLAEQVENG